MRRGLVLGAVLALLVAGTAGASSPRPLVAGSYSYWFNGHTTTVQVSAHGGAHISGWVRVQSPAATFGGPVTCVKVVGRDAWVAGRVAYGSAMGLDAWWLRVTDGGAPGHRGDLAITFADYPDSAAASCASADRSLDDLRSPVVRGNLVAHG